MPETEKKYRSRKSTEFIGVRLTPLEREACEQAAKEASLTLSEWIRREIRRAAMLSDLPF